MESVLDTLEGSYSGSGDGNHLQTCSAEILERPSVFVLSLALDLAVRGMGFVYGMLVVTLGISLNGLIVMLVSVNKKLRNTSFGIAVQISLVNIPLTLVRCPLLLVNQVAGGWIFNSSFCVLTVFLIYVFNSVRTLLVFVFAVDRFTTVFMPFRYPKHHRVITSSLCILAWLVSILAWSIGLLPTMKCYVFSEPLQFCVLSPTCSPACTAFYYACLIALVILPIVIPAELFLAMYCKRRRIRQGDLSLGLAEKTITDQEWRAITTFSLLFLGVFLVVFVPFSLFQLAELFSLINNLGVAIIVVNTITDPIIIMRNADVREALDRSIAGFKNVCRKLRRNPGGAGGGSDNLAAS